jgi:Uma2 family endonuclease
MQTVIARLTAAEYYATPEYAAHSLIQLIDGEMVIGMAPIPRHQEIVGNVHVMLWMFARQRGGRAYIAPIEVELDESNVYEPDVLYIAPNSACQVTEKRLIGAPDLVVEVLSPSTAKHDRVAKFRTYGLRGVREYWIVDPQHNTLEQWTNEAGNLRLVSAYGLGDSFTSALFGPEAPIALDDIFGVSA